eukprot:XP_011664562.1 PREDICTED: hyalin-like [Strongylocentrotus purpuratus]
MTVPFGSSPTTVSWTEPLGVASVAASQSSGSFFVVEYTYMVYTATDPSGNFESCSFSVTVTVGANPCSSNPCAPSEQCFYIPSRYLCIKNDRRRREAEMLNLS